MQLVWVTPRDGSGPWVSLDMDPRHYPVHLSYEAALFDAPGPNPPRRNERWEAQTYLMACLDVGRSPAVFPLLGVRWGYDLVDGVVAARPLEGVGADTWQGNLAFLTASCPGWTFGREFHDATRSTRA